LGFQVDQSLIRSLLADDRQGAAAKARAVRYLTEVNRPEAVELLSQLARCGDLLLATEAVQSLASASDKSATPILLALAGDLGQPTALRCDAIMALAAAEAGGTDNLLPLTKDRESRVALTTVRALTFQAEQDPIRQAFRAALTATASASDVHAAARFDQLRFALKVDAADRPRTDEQWKTAMQARGDPEAGRRVFFDRRVGCAKCHSIEGRGGRIGPNLSNIAAAKTRDEILSSILNPAQEKSPDYQGYIVRMNDGRIYRGTQFHFRGEAAELLLDSGQQVRFALGDTEEYRALDESLMPEGLEETMSVGELRDLVDFLTTLRPPAAGQP
jgi:putative heme-binding domain-containing protein